MSVDATLTASLEDYLEAIFTIIRDKQAVRPKDIAKRLGVGNSSVTGALRALAEKELINYAPYDVITLTHTGKEAAREVVRRHEVLRDFFVNVLAVDEKDADTAACQMEHSIPKLIIERFVQFAEFVEVCPRGGAKWIAGFGYHCDWGASPETCERCIGITLDEVRERGRQEQRKPMQSTTLRALESGQKGKIVKVTAQGELGRRVMEMGLVPGAVVELERIAPLGDPIDVKVKGYHLSLRKDEAEQIHVEAL